MIDSKYQPIIGLEIHVELKTKSKMFCQCSADYFGKEPNTNTCPVCLGMPGALPVPNKKAVEWTVLIGQALNCTINKHSKFDRKHYFYPDIPKGYQISQYDEPLCSKGYLKIKSSSKGHSGKPKAHPESDPGLSQDDNEKIFMVTRVHLEEDTGKLMHEGKDTLVDFNRSGVPLVEIVTEADFDNSADVKVFLEELQTIIRYLGVSDADMEKGNMRVEPNISVKLKTQEGFPPYKVEVKNINSFNFARKAIEYEIKRHIEILEEGKIPIQETRGYNDQKGTTYSQRSKEEAHDYRYFPEPDIPPMEFTDEELDAIKKQMPELPAEKVKIYVSKFGVKYQDAFTLSRDKKMTRYFEEVISNFKSQISNQQLKIQNFEQSIANFIVNKRIPTILSVNNFVEKALELLKPKETDTALLSQVIEKVIQNNQKVVDDYKNGKQNAIMFLVGQVMREMKGQAEAVVVRNELEKKLK